MGLAKTSSVGDYGKSLPSLGDIKTTAAKIADKGWACISNSSPQVLAQNSIVEFYNKKKALYDNAELVVASWQSGISSLRNGDDNYGGLGIHAGKYYIGQDNGLFSTTDYIAGELTQINNVITSDIYCFDNIIIQRNAAGGLNKIDYETLTTTSILSFSGQLNGGSLKCHKEDDGYIYITDASLFTVHRILDAADAEIELLYTHGTTAVYDCRKKGTKFIVVAADGVYTTSDFVTMSLKYDIHLNGATLLYHVATNKFIVVPFSEGGDVPVYTSVDEFENVVEVATGVARNKRTAYLDGNNLYILAVGGYPYNASYYTQTIANIAVGWTRVAIANTNITWMTFFGNTMLATVSDKLYYSGLVKKTYTKTYSINGVEIVITYYLGSDGSKICISETTQNAKLAILFNILGYVEYFVLDTTNKTLVLLRVNIPITYMFVGGEYIDTTAVAGSFERFVLLSELSRLPYSQLKEKTVGNTIVETSLFNTTSGEYTGSNIIPANSLKPGDIIHVCIKGALSTASSAPTNTVKIKLGAVVLVEDAKQITASLSNCYFKMEKDFLVQSIGSEGVIVEEGDSFFKDKVNFSGGAFRPLSSEGGVTVNTTIANALDVTYIWGAEAEANTITSRIAYINILKA